MINNKELLDILLNNNIEELKDYLKVGNPNIELDTNDKHIISITQRSEVTPIQVAIAKLHYDMVELLVTYGVDISDKLEYAVRTDDEKMIHLLVNLGARLDYIDRVGKSAYLVAYYSKSVRALQVLRDLGLDVSKYGGESFRSAASSNEFKFTEFFYDNGVDINFNKPDMVFPYGPTAVTVAASHNNFEMVKWLADRGADITIADKGGGRPYTYAMFNKNSDMAEFLKALEPPEWHDEEQTVIRLKSYKLPKSLISFLRGDNLRIHVDHNMFFYIVFNSLVECKEVKWNGYKFLDLLCEVEHYHPDGFLVWYPNEKCLASADYEHDEFRLLGKWEDFIQNPSHILSMVFG